MGCEYILAVNTYGLAMKYIWAGRRDRRLVPPCWTLTSESCHKETLFVDKGTTNLFDVDIDTATSTEGAPKVI